jgi:hypothetical protein
MYHLSFPYYPGFVWWQARPFFLGLTHAEEGIQGFASAKKKA